MVKNNEKKWWCFRKKSLLKCFIVNKNKSWSISLNVETKLFVNPGENQEPTSAWRKNCVSKLGFIYLFLSHKHLCMEAMKAQHGFVVLRAWMFREVGVRWDGGGTNGSNCLCVPEIQVIYLTILVIYTWLYPFSICDTAVSSILRFSLSVSRAVQTLTD